MLVATNTTGQQQIGNNLTSLNSGSCLPSGSACTKTNTSSSNNKANLSPNSLTIMSSSLDVTTPTTATVSPTSNNNANAKCTNSNNNNGSQKYEASYGVNATSPCNSDGNNSQNLDDSNGNNKNKTKNSNGVNLSVLDSTSRGERDSLSNISSNSLIRQSSASTNSCSVQFNESSPNNGDSSNSSSNASHMNNDINKTSDEEKLNSQTTKNNTINKEEDRDKTNISTSTASSSSGNASANTSLPNQTSISSIKAGLPATAIVKDEKDLVKKEETSLSPPNMSPVGFGSIAGTQINECNDNAGSANSKSNDSCDKRMGLPGNVSNDDDENSANQSTSGLLISGSGPNLNLISSCNSLNTNTNPLNTKSSLDGISSDTSTTTPIGSNAPCNIPLNASFIINNLSNTNGPPQGGGGVTTNIISGGGSSINNCMEYMQQQNHIFVFSTQLANKGAEAVLAGQFPTIIAYHCTQPATKSFFEDFFLKNPMKMTKLQRQNTLSIMGGLPPVNGPGSGGQPPWLTGNCNSMGKISHKLTLNKSAETITTSSASAAGGGVLNENDMMCWDQSRSVIDSSAGDSTNTMKILENSENSSSAAKSVGSGLSNDEGGGIPSLQGVKVPDENLTPQQRQHREEQLAKLKKMNQFLFPENGGNDFHSQASGNNPMMTGKIQMPPESLPGGMPGNPVALLNMQSPNMGNKINSAAMRNISGSLMNHSKTNNSNSQIDNMPNLGEDIIMPVDMMAGSGCGPNEMGAIPSLHKQGCMPNMNNPSGLGSGGGRGNLMNAGGSNLNMMNNGGPIGMPSGSLMNEPNNTIMGSSSDVLSPFNSNHCPNSSQDGGGSSMIGPHKNMNAPASHTSDMNSGVGMPQIEWSKLQHHIYEERLKNNHSNTNSIPPEIGGGCQQTLQRCNSTGMGGGGGTGGMSHRANSNTNGSNRGNQGPPPPYHPTQRSASVPIATQSPNPSSPNNPTSNMSLPSPRASNTMGGVLSSRTSPNMDVTSTSSTSTANTNSTITTTAAVGGGGPVGGNGSTNKNTFSQQGSPTPGSGSGNSNRNRSSVNNLNSNPTTPLSHVSPKDTDSKNINTTPDHKSTRPNSQRSRSPLLNDASNSNAMEPRFPSPGLNFASNGTSSANNQNLPNSFKNQNSSLEQRQNLQQMPPQFCRRSDNMPLNPNSNRSNQTKMSNTFDPISSLAQMSQQLTGGGVGLNSGGVSNSPNNMSGLMGGPGVVNDINMNGLMAGPMMGGPVDPNMEHCNQNPNGGGVNMGMSGLGGGHGSVTGPFGSGNCNIMAGNPGPICQRLLNPKMCGSNMSGGFNANQVGGIGMRDGPSGFPGMMPSHRMMNHRMSANFGNFNVSPNIQVKASTPNTIQYMPVRPQNNNNSMRVPPSLEFLQRYANPQMLGNSGSGVGPNAGPPSDMPAVNGTNDLNKMQNTNNIGVNSNAMNQMNFFGNCHQMSSMSGMGQPIGGGCSDQDELQSGRGMSSNHDPMNIPVPHAPMLRGMRPMRQSGLQPGVGMNSGSRMQHPGMANIPPNGLGNNIFPGNDNESLDCNDPTNGMFNTATATGLYQQKSNKHPMGMSHGPSNLNSNNGNNAPLPNNTNVLNDQNPSSNPMQNSVMMGANNSMLNSNIPNSNNDAGPGQLSGPSNMGYKPFVGPTSNDIKYAQQYHSFQQQLYATSTRNQQPGGQQQPPNAMSPNGNPNAGFFVNK